VYPGELAYLQTDLSVANDSFEVTARFKAPDIYHVSTSWLVNVVSLPLLKRIKEVRSFIKGFAVGGILTPDESDFSATYGSHTTLSLAVLDASPLAAITGANPVYEIVLPPNYGQLYKIPAHKSRYRRQTSQREGRVASRFSHEDVRRGSIIYYSQTNKNELSDPSYTAQADEFIFKIFAFGVQPALGLAKFNLHHHRRRNYYDDKNHEQIISDGSTDPATKRSGGGPTSMRDITLLVTPHMTKDSLVTVGIVVGGVITLSLLLVAAIRCSCSKKPRRRDVSDQQQGQQRRRNSSVLNNGGMMDQQQKTNGIGIIDAYAPSSTCTRIDPCQSDSEKDVR